MKRVLAVATIVGLLAVAYVTKPDDKTCIIAAVKAVWGRITPDPYKAPTFYEEFMNLNAKAVVVDDWIFLKRIRYTFPKKQYTIGIGAFNHIFTNG